MVAGNPKLNLAYVAHLFNTWPGLEVRSCLFLVFLGLEKRLLHAQALEESEKPVIEEFDAEGEREARVFTLWLNSLNVDPAVYDLFENLKVSGSVLWTLVCLKKVGV